MDDFEKQIEDDLLRGLNPVQREAVLHETGPLLILAGAGSGKTRVITHRIAYLIRIRKVRPGSIAAVTFTNKAAREMADRLAALIGPLAEKVTVRTFHSLGLYIIRNHYKEAGLSSNFSIYDSAAQKALVKQILKEQKIEKGFLSPEAVISRMEKARDSLRGLADFESARDPYSLAIRDIYSIYKERLRANNAVDYSDLIFESVLLLRNNEEVRSYYADRWQHFLIDEYQDTNHAQYVLGSVITAKHKNIVVVGDDDQSIYSWRGADLRNILEFEQQYPETKVLKLEENYRSTPEILKIASSVIANNAQRKEKTLFTSQPAGEKVKVSIFDNEHDEARVVVSKIRTYRRDGIRLADMAVFYRTNAQSRVFEDMLREANLPYVLYGGFRFYDRKEIKDMIAYLQVLVNPGDDVSFARIINVPARGIGEKSVEKIRMEAAIRSVSLFDQTGDAASVPGLRSHSKLTDLYEKFLSWQSIAETELPSEVAGRVFEQSGLMQSFQDDSDPEARSRLENLYEFIGSIQEYEQSLSNTPGSPRPTLADYLQTISLYTSESNPDSDTDPSQSVQLMTLHNAKGLEFPVVFLTGLEEGLLPHQLSMDDSVEEERRLVYVGVTRAKEILHLSWCRFRRIAGQLQPRAASRFIEETGLSELPGREKRTVIADSAPFAGNIRIRNQEAAETAVSQYREGDRVRHKKYGNGTVRSLEKTVAGFKLFILFDDEDPVNGRQRAFLEKYTPLQKISES